MPITKGHITKAEGVIACVVGPTCSGKSRLAHEVAMKYKLDVVSVDSGMIYRQMDIGTDKPTPTQQQQVNYQMIDILNPMERYSVVQFCQTAWRITRDRIHAGTSVLFVGGTMMYMQALLANWFKTRNPSTPIKSFIFVPYSKQELDAKVAFRFESMVDRGFEKECQDLLEQFPELSTSPAYRLVGYRQMFSYLQLRYSYVEMLERAIIATRQLAKKQFTWLRGYSFGEMVTSDAMLTDSLLEFYADANRSN